MEPQEEAHIEINRAVMFAGAGRGNYVLSI